MYGIRRKLQEQGFSGTATEIIMASWRPDTKKVYNVYIKLEYTDRKKVDSVSLPLTESINFLSELLSHKASYSSALSSYLNIENVGGLTVSNAS